MTRSRSRWMTSLLIATAIAGIGGMLANRPMIQRLAFCAPAAKLTALLSGAPCLPDGDDYRLIGARLDLLVVPACAATDYFCLLAAFLSLLAARRGFRTSVQFLVLPAAWFLTILINALRLTACWQTDSLARQLMPQSLWPAIHMAVGVATFLAGLVFVFWGMTHGVAKKVGTEPDPPQCNGNGIAERVEGRPPCRPRRLSVEPK